MSSSNHKIPISKLKIALYIIGIILYPILIWAGGMSLLYSISAGTYCEPGFLFREEECPTIIKNIEDYYQVYVYMLVLIINVLVYIFLRKVIKIAHLVRVNFVIGASLLLFIIYYIGINTVLASNCYSFAGGLGLSGLGCSGLYALLQDYDNLIFLGAYIPLLYFFRKYIFSR